MEYHDKSFYECQCASEVLNVQRDIEVFDYEKEAWDIHIYLAMYHLGTENHRPVLRDKLRHCWKILKTGKNYADNIILSLEDARKLSRDLNEMCDETKIKEEAEKMLNEKRGVINEKKGN